MRQSIGRFVVGLVLVTGVGAGTGLGAALVAPGVAGAAQPIAVNVVGDATPVPTNCVMIPVEGPCTLRAAIDEANNEGGVQTISVPDPTTLTPSASAYVLNDTLGPLEIDDTSGTVTIGGPGQSPVTIEASTSYDTATTRVFQVDSGASAIISEVTIANGVASVSGSGGGGILNDGTLTLNDSTVTANDTNGGPGGGIYADLATTTLDGDVVSSNNAVDGAGIYAEGGTTTLSLTQVSGNTATTSGQGGGIYIDSQSTESETPDTSFTMNDSSRVVSNTAVSNGGGIEIAGANNVNTVVDIDSSTINYNTSSANGAGIAQDADSTLTVTNSTIDGNGATDDGGGVLLQDDSTSVDSFSNDTIGEAGKGGANTAFNGGGVYIGGIDPTFTDDTITDNTVSGDGGGVYISGGTNTFTGDGTNISSNMATVNGGGVYIEGGTNSFTDGTIGSNMASDGGGFFVEDGTNTFSGNTISQNQVSDAGGGVFISNGESCSNSFSSDTVAENQSTSVDAQGGGFYIEGCSNTFSNETIGGSSSADANTISGSDGEGGGVYIAAGTNSFTGGAISNNQLTGDNTQGGGVGIGAGTNTFTGVSITSNQAQNGGYGGGVYTDGGTNAFTDTTVNSDQAIWTAEQGGGQGGGFYYQGGTNTFTGGSIDSNTAYDGGGAYLDGGTETFLQADISSNTASESAGGLWISIGDIDEPTTITSSTISQNRVPGLIGVTPLLGDGGGILAYSCDGYNQINLTNDTIAGNSANLLGGGYYGTDACLEAGVARPAAESAATSHATSHVTAEPVTNFLFDTIDANSSGSGGGNVNTDDASILNAAQTIIADGVSADVTATNCTFNGGGTLTSGGYNLIDDTTCGSAASTDIIGQPAQLGALGNNGGPTNTELPASTSPAVGAVPASVCSGTGVTTDQRGNARGAGLNGSCTIGAVEVSVAAPPAFNPNGYRLVANEGGIFDFGLNFDGSLANNHLNAPIIGIANSPGYDGYVMAGSDGGVFALGGANFYGSLGGQAIPSPISAIAAPPSENGYWLVAQNGKIYNYGSAPALPAVQLPAGAHIVGMASTTDGGGGWLTDQFGDVYAEGDALYEGGLGGVHINAPIVGIAAAAAGQGYVLAASDGGVFNYGTQGFFGSVPGSLQPGQHLVAPIVGIAVTHSGHGYWLAGADGGVFNYGDAPFLGSIYTAIPGKKLNGPVVGIQHLGSA